MRRSLFLLLVFVFGFFVAAGFAATVVPSTIDQPGTQPQQVGNLESPDKCDNCHGGYNTATEPAFNWRGSMMANAGRDPIFWATLAIAEQGFDGAGDLCIRCHSTAGWLGGRSTPTDGSGLAAGDSDGVECDYCHKATNTDNTEHLGVMTPPFVANDGASPTEGYLGSGMASIADGAAKLGPYAETDARHQYLKSKFHRSVDFCGTCHDVSNPAVGNLAHNFGAQAAFLATETVSADGSPNESPKKLDTKAAFSNKPYQYGVVERTFSEYKAGLISQTKVDDYLTLPADLQAGALKSIYESATQNGTVSADYEDGDPRFYSCQSCHMRPVYAQGCNKNPPFRNDMPLHDMTGGNYWMPQAIKYLDGQGKLRLGGGMNAVQLAALDAGALRAEEQLSLAATLSVLDNSLKVINHTGHKLISGYPEGRRMWLNIKWYDTAGTLLREDGKYGAITVDINGTLTQVETILNLDDPNTRIYEAHYGLDQGWAAQLTSLGYSGSMALSYDRTSGTPVHTLGELAAATPGTEFETFHFVLNNVVHKDNRIPPYGMDYESARLRNALPVPETQFNGGPGKTYDYFDTFALNPPAGATNANISLLYQPTSWEYIQFLYLGNNQPAGSFLENEGDYMLEAWLNTGMAAPYVMATTVWGDAPQCQTPTPTLISATPGNSQVALTWSDEKLADPQVAGYKVYYDQAGKSQLITTLGAVTSFTDTGVTNGQEYCYKVAAFYDTTCESSASNVICAIPNNQGQARVGATLKAGRYSTTGQGKNKVTVFVESASFTAGDAVVVRATVLDQATGLPVPNASVNLQISGPENLALVTAPSAATGLAEVVWQTLAPNRKGQGGTTPGVYSAQVTNITATGYVWDGALNSITFTLQ